MTTRNSTREAWYGAIAHDMVQAPAVQVVFYFPRLFMLSECIMAESYSGNQSLLFVIVSFLEATKEWIFGGIICWRRNK